MTTSSSGQPGADTESALRRLVLRGFRFLHPRDGAGELVAVIGVRAHHHVIDVVRLHAEDDAVANRIPASEIDVLAPRRTLWQVSGRAADVLADLLALPDDYPAGEPAGREQAHAACWAPVATGRLLWATRRW
ncbi:hypothetical protein [Gandjariella thermophila]|uniref:Uncharacterized protein n=1 Tax=Gandjariella thermophila TaxID=1931992 RepID=A0A4D4JFK9_9PSEU|nr:hypothetical protein [Gandjariella thermophila]GDY32663.1 hypothetical protein GTS_42960 [Gandjariella thermophila]